MDLVYRRFSVPENTERGYSWNRRACRIEAERNGRTESVWRPCQSAMEVAALADEELVFVDGEQRDREAIRAAFNRRFPVKHSALTRAWILDHKAEQIHLMDFAFVDAELERQDLLELVAGLGQVIVKEEYELPCLLEIFNHVAYSRPYLAGAFMQYFHDPRKVAVLEDRRVKARKLHSAVGCDMVMSLIMSLQRALSVHGVDVPNIPYCRSRRDAVRNLKGPLALFELVFGKFAYRRLDEFQALKTAWRNRPRASLSNWREFRSFVTWMQAEVQRPISRATGFKSKLPKSRF